MERRDFIVRSASVVGGALGFGLLGGCATTGGVRFRDGGPDINGYLAGLDTQVARIHATRIGPQIIKHLKKQQLPESFLQDNLASLLVVGAFRDLPPSLQAEPQMQARIQQETPGIGRQVLMMASHLDGLSDEERSSIQQYVQEQPDVLDLMREGMVGNASVHGLDSRRVSQFSRMLTDVHWRLQQQDPSLLIDETVDRTDKMCRLAGVRREDWKALIEGAEDDQRPDAPAGKVNTAGTVAIVGGALMGIGSGVVLGSIGILNDADTGYVTVGGILAMIGLSMLIIAAALDYVKRKRDRCSRQKKK